MWSGRRIVKRRGRVYNDDKDLSGKLSDLDYLVKADIPGLKGVYLFGSCARGNIRNGSDIDLLIFTEQKLEDRALAADIRWTLDDEISGISTDVVYANKESILREY